MTGRQTQMETLRDIRDRIMKRMLRCPRMARNLLALLPAGHSLPWLDGRRYVRLGFDQVRVVD